MHRVYLDNNATTPLLPEVFEAMRPYFFEKFGNASSIHQQGQQARSAVEHAREQVAELLNCRPAEIVFTSGGTEGDNLALFGLMKPGDHLITSSVEHHAVLNACKRLEEMGCAVTYLPVDGRALVDPDDVRRALRPETKLISIILANNETGVLQPVSEIGKIASEADVYFHTDAVQAAGKVPLDVKEIGCDLLTITGHKMHGPQGAGALFVRRGTLLQPMMYGGRHERSRRAGTENLAGIVGLGKAAEMVREGFADGSVERMAGLRDRLEQGLIQRIGHCFVTGDPDNRLPNTANVAFEYIEGEGILLLLNKEGIAASSGSACTSGSLEPSHVLRAMNIPDTAAHGAIRFSLSRDSTDDEVDRILAVMPDIVDKLRGISPFWSKEGAPQAFDPAYA